MHDVDEVARWRSGSWWICFFSVGSQRNSIISTWPNRSHFASKLYVSRHVVSKVRFRTWRFDPDLLLPHQLAFVVGLGPVLVLPLKRSISTRPLSPSSTTHPP